MALLSDTMDGAHTLLHFTKRSTLFNIVAMLIFLDLLKSSHSANCHINTTNCIPFGIVGKKCLGTTLDFQYTSLEFANDSSTLAQVDEKLALWSGLQNVPQCWSVVQPFLCSVYFPKCDNNTDLLELPSKELCEKIREPCKIVESFHSWPSFLQCHQPHFQENCKPETYEKASFNTTGRCEPPLIKTSLRESWYEDVEGCGIQCQNPLFTNEEHQEVHAFVAVWGALCLVCTLFTVLTFVIDWKNANKYPALILFYINACFFVGSIGWLAQFAGNAREDIVCRSDRTARMGEPQLGSGESASCTVVFLLVYYSMMAGVTWFVMLAYAWHITFKALGTPRDNLSSKTAYFHLVSWFLPLVLSIICLAISEIDGDSLSGICFVGYMKHGIRAGFVLGPIAVVLVCGLVFLVRGLITLIKIRKNAPTFISEKATSKIRETILRLGIFATLAFVFVLITFSVHVYTFANENKWRESFKEYMYCEANVTITRTVTNTTGRTCEVAHKPSVVALEIHIFAFFGAGIAMSSWSWNKASFNAWERFLRKVFRKPSNKPVKLKKHKMIAQAFEKRKNINNGRMSISFHSTHDDPLGMKFDLNSVSSHDMSSNFAAAMPKLVRRRGGLIQPVAGTLRRYSDSDIGSVISRRMSQDSQLGQAIGQPQLSIDPDSKAEKKKRKKKKKKRRRAHKIQPIIAPVLNALHAVGGRRGLRRGSDTSVISRASAHSVRVSIERNSMEAISIASVPMSHHGDIDTVDLSQIPSTRAGSQPAKPHTNFSLFTASGLLQPRGRPSVQEFAAVKRSRRSRRSEVTVEMSESNFQSSRPRPGQLKPIETIITLESEDGSQSA
ncbi:protein smoothened-like [Haliotis cracherodii]|uniref:protein smoothened-like n=1 Tax=Haliotis cracherodii TaxID=6455 RepID=UPI0039EAAC96